MEKPWQLGYWNCRGVVERVRMLMKYCDFSYEEIVYDGEEGRKVWFNEKKPKLMLEHPAITLPYVIESVSTENIKEEVGKAKRRKITIVESDAISVFVCQQTNQLQLLGRDLDEQLIIASVNAVFKEFYPVYQKLVYGKYKNEEEFKDIYVSQCKNFESYLTKLEGMLGKMEFMAGKLTWIDFSIADITFTLNVLNADMMKKYPGLLEHSKRVRSLPRVKEYVQSEECQKRPFNNYTAYWNHPK